MPEDALWRPGETVLLATCAAGMESDRHRTGGHDHTTAINPYRALTEATKAQT